MNDTPNLTMYAVQRDWKYVKVFTLCQKATSENVKQYYDVFAPVSRVDCLTNTLECTCERLFFSVEFKYVKDAIRVMMESKKYDELLNGQFLMLKIPVVSIQPPGGNVKVVYGSEAITKCNKIHLDPSKMFISEKLNSRRCRAVREKKCSIDMLDEFSLSLILAYLPKLQLIKCERVSKRWQVVCRGMWQRTRDLDFSWLKYGDHSLNTDIIHQMLVRCGPNLTSLDVSYEPKNTCCDLLKIIAKYCPNLQLINLSNTQMTHSGLGLIGRSCTKLSTINFGQCFGVRDKALCNFFHLAKKLETIIIDKALVDGSCLQYLNQETIRKLSLTSCFHLNGNNVSLLGAVGSNLTLLTLTNVTLSSQEACVLFNGIPQLQTLKLHASSVVLYEAIPLLSELVTLDIGKSACVTDEILIAIVKSCKKIAHFSIAGSSESPVSDSGLSAVATLPSMTYLNISKLQLLTDRTLFSLAENAKKMKTLVCHDCPFRDLGCSRIVSTCPELQLFDMTGCVAVTVQVVKAAYLARAALNGLLSIELKVSGTKVTKYSVLMTLFRMYPELLPK